MKSAIYNQTINFLVINIFKCKLLLSSSYSTELKMGKILNSSLFLFVYILCDLSYICEPILNNLFLLEMVVS